MLFVSRAKVCENALIFLVEAVDYNSNQNYVEIGIGINNEIISITEGLEGDTQSESKQHPFRYLTNLLF